MSTKAAELEVYTAIARRTDGRRGLWFNGRVRGFETHFVHDTIPIHGDPIAALPGRRAAVTRHKAKARSTPNTQTIAMVVTRSQTGSLPASSSAKKYSVILPTYNERENLPLTVSMLVRIFEEQ